MAMSMAAALVHQTVSAFLATTSVTTLLTKPVILVSRTSNLRTLTACSRRSHLWMFRHPYIHLYSAPQSRTHAMRPSLTPLPQLLTHQVLTTAYNLFLSPLRRFPGPKSCAVSYWPYWLGHLKLRWHLQSKKLHDEYGDVVRIAPDRLDFVGAQAWRGERAVGHSELS